MHLPVALEYARLLPRQEVEAVFARLRDQPAQLPRRNPAHRRGRVQPDTEQYLVLDDVADARKDVLVQQGVAHQDIRLCAKLGACAGRAPFGRQYICPPVVDLVQRCLDVLEGRRIDIQHAIVEA
jgi:hypothetical protein